MRWGKSNIRRDIDYRKWWNTYGEWHPSFAWFPVRFQTGGLAWMEAVERKAESRVVCVSGARARCWVYRRRT